MTLFCHELRQGRRAFAVWTAAIAFLIAVCLFLFPEMKGQMDGVSELFASMGSFTAAFGMDRLSFGTLSGFYAVECGNILGLGGGFFAALLGISALAKEEQGRTAEFLLTHPVSRAQVLGAKLGAVLAQLLALNVLVFGVAAACIGLTGEQAPWRELALLHLANLLLQLELACLCFGISAFLRRGSLGVGLGAAAGLYFLNIISNLSERTDVLKYFTPFAYAEGADVLADGRLDPALVLLGLGASVLAAGAAWWYYGRKDIH